MLIQILILLVSLKKFTNIQIQIESQSESLPSEFSLEPLTLNVIPVLFASISFSFLILLSKKFNNINDMKEIQFSDDATRKLSKKNDFIYSFLSSLRQKINDPLGKRKK